MTLKQLVRCVGLFLALFIAWKIIPHHFGHVESQGLAKEERRPRPYDEYIVYVNQVRRAVAGQMLEEMGLICTGDISQMHEKVEELGMKFTAYRHATLEEARALHVLVLGKLAAAINAHEKLQPFLEERPFTHKRVEVGISFKGSGKCCFEGNIARISNVASRMEERNCLYYNSEDCFTEELVDLFKEPYATAIEIVKASPLQNPAIHQAKPIEEVMDGILSTFVKKMREEHGLRCYSIGGRLTDHVEEIGASFTIIKHASQKQARKITSLVVESLLQEINSNDQLKPYLKEYPFPIDRVKLRIHFKKRNGYSYCDGSVKQITVEGKEISYFRRLPNLAEFEEVFAKEGYSQAKDKVKI